MIVCKVILRSKEQSLSLGFNPSIVYEHAYFGGSRNPLKVTDSWAGFKMFKYFKVVK